MGQINTHYNATTPRALIDQIRPPPTRSLSIPKSRGLTPPMTKTRLAWRRTVVQISYSLHSHEQVDQEFPLSRTKSCCFPTPSSCLLLCHRRSLCASSWAFPSPRPTHVRASSPSPFPDTFPVLIGPWRDRDPFACFHPWSCRPCRVDSPKDSNLL